jgi:hypothetical protein
MATTQVLPATGFPPTGEQVDILAAVATGGTTGIVAGAGTGKTSTLRLIAAAHPTARILYIAYNKAIQLEADKSFPANVQCRTGHSLAYKSHGAPMRSRLNGPRQTGRQRANVFGIRTAFGTDGSFLVEPAELASMVSAVISRFCHSADMTITRRHFAPPEGLEADTVDALAGVVVGYAAKVWADLMNPNGKIILGGRNDDVYLKMWQLSTPRLGFDVILYDEAQDADPCIADVVARQTHAQIIAVGDSAQAIYGWRGAGDFLADLDTAHRCMLSQSWRFGPAVSDEANVWLGVVGTPLRLTGNPGRASVLGAVEAPDAILCRTNAGTIAELLEAHAAGIKVELVGGGKEMLALARAADRMEKGQPAAHPDLVAFKSWAEVVKYANEDPTGSDLAVSVRMIETYGAETVIDAISRSTTRDLGATLTVSTAHKAKGLEWDSVRIANDFKEPIDAKTGEPLPIPRTDAMLAYVSITRAKLALDTGGLGWVHGHLAALAAKKA